MKRTKLLAALAIGLSFAIAPAHAAPDANTTPAASPAQKKSGIHGRVYNDNTKKYLELAVVTITETDQKVMTEPDGGFRFADLPAGTYTLVAAYTDLENTSTTVTVKDNEIANVEIALTSPVYTLGSMVVSSPREGASYAIQQQRQSESVRSITSIDTFIDQTTGNPGEFLKNIESVQMDYSQNEPQVIRIRGLNANFTSVTMDGLEIASVNSSNAARSVQVDQLSIAIIKSTEVYKSPIPSMSSNAIGGAVNFVSKSAFDRKGGWAFAQIGVNMDSNDFSFERTPGPGHGTHAERRIYPIGRVEIARTFFDNRLGMVFSVGRDLSNQLGSSTTQNLMTPTPLPGQARVPAAPELFTQENVVLRRAQLSMSPNRQLRERRDISLNTDFKATDDLSLYLKMTLSDYQSTNRNHGFSMNPDISTDRNTSVVRGALAPGATLTDYTYTALGNDTNVVTTPISQSTSIFNKYTQTWMINPGVKFRTGDWKMHLNTGMSKSVNHYKNDSDFTNVNIQMRNSTANRISWRMATPVDTEVPDIITQLTGPSMYDLNNYNINQTDLSATSRGAYVGKHLANDSTFVGSNIRDAAEIKWQGLFDVQRDFDIKFPFYLKSGISYNETIFEKHQNQRRWYWMGQDGVATPDDVTTAVQLNRFAEPIPVTMNIPGWNLREPTYISAAEVHKYWQANPQVLQENTAYAYQQQIAGRAKIHEEISAAYIMANATFFKKLNVLTGLRLERTIATSTGYQVLPNRGATALPTDVNPNSLEGIQALYRPLVVNSQYTPAPFKSMHLKYNWLPNLLSRLSYADSIGRANLSDMVPNGTTYNETDTSVPSGRSISTNQPDIRPQYGKNYDLTLEYYTKASSKLTVGIWRRDIKDYIASTFFQLTPDVAAALNLDPSYVTDNYYLKTTGNVGAVRIQGFEVTSSLALREFEFIPKALQGITIWGNYSRIAKMEGTIGNPPIRVDQWGGTVPEQVNAGLRYSTPKNRFMAQVSTNYQSPKVNQNQPATNAAGQQNARVERYQFWNAEASFRIQKNLKLTATGRNLLSTRQENTNVGVVTSKQQATGIAWTFALKYDL